MKSTIFKAYSQPSNANFELGLWSHLFSLGTWEFHQGNEPRDYKINDVDLSVDKLDGKKLCKIIW